MIGGRGLPVEFHVLVAALTADLGGETDLTTGERALVEQAASILVRVEAHRAQLLNGDVDDEALVRLTNCLARIVGALGGVKRRAKPVLSFRERLLQEIAEEEAAKEEGNEA